MHIHIYQCFSGHLFATRCVDQKCGALPRRARLRATLDVPKPKSGGLVKKVGPFSKRTNPL